MSALATLLLVSPSSAQQPGAAPVAPPAPVLSQPATTVPAPAAPATQAPAVAASSAQVPAAADANPAVAADANPLKSTGLHELSPWSMLQAAVILVKAVMIGLAFASLMTWTIFIAKMIEFSVVQRRLRWALKKIGDARSLAEAQFALGGKDSVLA